MTERRQDCLEETDVFPYVINTSYNDFLAVTLFSSLQSLGTLLCNLFQISKWKIKGKWTMIKQFKDYVTKGRTQNLKQVSTIKPQTPNRLQTLPNKAKSSDKINSLKEIILGIKAKEMCSPRKVKAAHSWKPRKGWGQPIIHLTFCPDLSFHNQLSIHNVLTPSFCFFNCYFERFSRLCPCNTMLQRHFHWTYLEAALLNTGFQKT